MPRPRSNSIIRSRSLRYPWGSRVKLDPWAGQLKFVKAQPPRIYSAKDKLALEVTPFSPYLVRLKPAGSIPGAALDSLQER